jgi:predicted transcriptional regulator
MRLHPIMARTTKKLGPVSIRLDADVRQGIEALAKADDRSLSAYINRVLRQHIEAVTGKRSTGTKT